MGSPAGKPTRVVSIPTKADETGNGSRGATPAVHEKLPIEGEGTGDASDASKPICFEDAVLVPRDDPMGIDLKPYHPRVPQTPEMWSLERDIFAVERVIRVLFSGKHYKTERKRFFDGLLVTANAGLVGSDYDVKTGRLDLALTQDEVADEFPKIRNAFWESYFFILLGFTLILGPLGCIMYYHFIV
jgi:hypothetical protein